MKSKILTVDDSKTIRLIVAKAFKQFDVDIFEASNGIEGLAVAAREKPDIIILDITMPVMDGAECIAKLKSSSNLKAIPVIMLTAESGRENVLKIAKMGVKDYLVKPFKEELLVERVGRIIELKAKGEDSKKLKRYDDVLNILVVDDKPAIIDQIKSALADTNWVVHGRTQTGEAVDYCSQNLPDVIIVSLTLPDAAGFVLFTMFRASAKTKVTPIFGMSVKTANDEQARAVSAGFTGIVTKPLDPEELKMKICRSLNLDTSYKYFQHRQGILTLILPQVLTPVIVNEINLHLRPKVADAVDSGLIKMVVDMSQTRVADVNLVRLGISAIQLCSELGLKHRLVGTVPVQEECSNYEETNEWQFVETFDEAVLALNGSYV